MFKTYSASAGSGKTFTLVVEYLTICFKNLCASFVSAGSHKVAGASRDAFRKILAMTFTNNAAAEMKRRIMDVLKELAFTPPEESLPNFQKYYEKIVEGVFASDNSYTPARTREIVCQAAQLQLQSILYDYDRFAVTTLDSFNQRIIRSSALRFGLSLNYTVELDLEEFYAEAIEEAVNALKKEDDFTQRVLWIMNNKMEDSGRADVVQTLMSTLKLLYEHMEGNYDFLKQLRALDKEKFEAQVKEWRYYVKTLPQEVAKTLVPVFTRMLHAMEDENGEKSPGINTYVYKMVKKWADKPETFIDLEKKEMEKREGYLTKFQNRDIFNKGGSLDSEAEQILDQSLKAIDRWQTHHMSRYKNTLLLLKNANKLLVIFDIQKKMETLKEMRGLFFLAESNILIHEELEGVPSGVSPAIYEKQGFHHFFIDEFQDTSRMQWQNLKPLIDNNAITQQGDVFLLGDVKQAIYRWRSGDAQILQDLSSFDTQNAHGYGFATLDRSNFHKESLNVNYRTTQAVVKFNNEFFAQYAEKMGCALLYEDVRQDPSRPQQGLTQVFFYRKDYYRDWCQKEALDRYPSLDQFIQQKGKEVSPREQAILFALRDALARGYSCSDVLLLFRKNDDLEQMSSLLTQAGLQTETKKSLSLMDAPEVIAVVYALKLVVNSHDLIAQTTVLHALSRIHQWPLSLPAEVSHLSESDDVFQNIIERFLGEKMPLSQWREEPLYVIVQNIIRTLHLEKAQGPFLNDFLNFVMEYLANRPDDPKAFLDRWFFLVSQDSIPSVQAFAKNDAVPMMTIHASKGLQKPVVIFPVKKSKEKETSFWTYDCTDPDGQRVAYLSGMKTNFEHSDFFGEYQQQAVKQNEDTLNVFYVAQTRPEDMLYIVSEFQDKPDTEGAEYMPFLQNFATQSFTQSETDPNTYYSGDLLWQKEQKNSPAEKESVTPPITVSDFSIEDLSPAVVSLKDEARQIGTRVHDYLARLSTFPQDDRSIETATSDAPEELRPYVTRFFKTIVEDNTLRPFFGPEAQVYNEVSILTVEGEVKRPDRVVFLQDQVRVFDYKTGHDHPEYHNQIAQYCQLIRDMGYEHVEGRLIFLDALETL